MNLTIARPKIASYPKYLEHRETHKDKQLIDERHLGVYEAHDQVVLFEHEGKPVKYKLPDELRTGLKISSNFV